MEEKFTIQYTGNLGDKYEYWGLLGEYVYVGTLMAGGKGGALYAQKEWKEGSKIGAQRGAVHKALEGNHDWIGKVIFS